MYLVRKLELPDHLNVTSLLSMHLFVLFIVYLPHPHMKIAIPFYSVYIV